MKFESIIELRDHYFQASKAVELGQLFKHQNTIFEYEDYHIYDLLTRVGTQTELKKFCHQSLNTLLLHDRSNSTDYFNTLHEYLKHAMSKPQTANALYIHRNTIDHRIQKISSLIGMNLDDGEDCFQLFLSFKIYELLNKMIPVET